MTGFNPECGDDFVYVFDPADPEHPYVAHIGYGQDAAFHPEYRGEGLFETEENVVVGDDDEFKPCVMMRFRIENDADGVPRVVDYKAVDYATAAQEGCL